MKECDRIIFAVLEIAILPSWNHTELLVLLLHFGFVFSDMSLNQSETACCSAVTGLPHFQYDLMIHSFCLWFLKLFIDKQYKIVCTL